MGSSPVDVSVVVATRNRAALLGACLDSLARQRTDARVEIVVVDNGSRDQTAALVTRYAHRGAPVRLVAEPEIGLSRAKNAGIASARGELVLFTDDDVVLSDGWIATYVEFFARVGARPVLAGGPVFPIAADLSPWPAWVTPGALADLPRLYHGAVARRLGALDWLWGANMGARRALFESVGGFDESVGNRGDARGTFEDVELVERVAASGGECWYLPAATLEHRTPADAARPRALAGKAFSRGANDVLRDRRGSYHERSLPVPRGRLPAALAAAPLMAGWVLSAAAFRATRARPAFELSRRVAWACGWCTAAATEGRPHARAWRRLAHRCRAAALRVTPP